MNEADDIMVAIQAIMEHVQTEFSSANGDGGSWVGVDADARLRLTRRIRDEVNRLANVFERVRHNIDAVPGGRISGLELDLALEKEKKELEIIRATQRELEALLGNLLKGKAASS